MAYRLIEAYDHSGGMNTREAPYLLNSREFADCENVTLEEAGKVKTRKGHENYCTLPAPTGLTEISDCDDETAGGTWTEYKDVVENESFPNADQAAPPDDHDVICAAATQTDIATALGVLTIAAQPTETSRMCFCVTNDSGGPLDLYEGTTTILVEGTYDGGNQYEEIEITSNAGNKSVATGKYRYQFGLRPFDTVTSVTQPDYATDAMAGTLKISIGIGTAEIYEGEGCLRDSVTLGLEIEDCDAAGGWTGHTAIDTVAPTPYEGTGCLRDSVTLGEVLDNCDEDTGWSVVAEHAIGYEGGALGLGSSGHPLGNTTVKTIAKDYSDYKDDAKFGIYLKTYLATGSGRFRVRLRTNSGAYFYKNFTVTHDAKWHQYTCYKSDFSEYGSPDWSNITSIMLTNDSTSCTVFFDYITWREKGRDSVTVTYTAAMDISDMLDESLFRFRFKTNVGLSTASVTVRFWEGVKRFYKTLYPNTSAGAWQTLSCFKSDFSQLYNPSWALIDKMEASFTFAYSSYQTPGTVVSWWYDIFEFVEKEKEGFATITFAAARDYSTMGDDTELAIWVKVPSGLAGATFALAFYDDSDYFITPSLSASVDETGWQKLTALKGAFTEDGTPDWSIIDTMDVFCTVEYADYQVAGTEVIWSFDYITWQESSADNKVCGIYEYRLPDGETIYRLAVIGTKIYDLDTLDELQSGGLTAALDCTFATMDGKVFLANGTDKMQYWDGSAATFADVGADTWPAGDDSPPECKYICVHKDRLWCFGCTADGLEAYLVFSELGDPSVADMWPANNWFHAGPHDGSIATGMVVFSDYLVCFTRKYVYCLYGSVSDDFNMVPRKDIPGCIAPKSISISDEGIFYLAADGIRLFNGNESYLLSDVIRYTIKNDLSVEDLQDAVGIYHNGTYRLWVVEKDGLSDEAYPDMALVYDPYLKAWVRWRGLYFNCFGVLGDELYGGLCDSPSIVKCDTGYSDDGAAIRTMLKTRQINAGVPERDKYFHHVYVVPESTAAAYDLSVRTQTEKSATYREYDIPLQSPDDNLAEHRETISLKGKYLELEFSHEGVNEPIAITGYRVGYKPLAVK